MHGASVHFCAPVWTFQESNFGLFRKDEQPSPAELCTKQNTMDKKETVLVTGGSGFLGMRIILQLLQNGYRVRASLRSLSGRDKVLDALQSNGIGSFERLSFVETELTADTGWAEAMQGCDCVLSVASPVFFEIPEDEAEAIRPAVEGTLRILRFARAAGVKRVVMTSSFGALGFSHTDRSTETTEADWTDPDLKGLSVYEKSKGLAERAAWDFMEREGGDLELAVINPVAILGPSLSGHVSGSFDLLRHLLDGSLKAVPPIPLNIADVRDVADLHLRAMTSPAAAGQRFIASADGQISLPQIARLLKEERPGIAAKVSLKILPGWLLRFAGLFNAQARGGAMLAKVNRRLSNSKAKKLLGWTPLHSQQEALLAAVDSMVNYGLIKA